jgi:hypothetical protein
MTWMWLSIIVILVGAKLNAEIEHQTARESTTGSPKPLGRRGAKWPTQSARHGPEEDVPSPQSSISSLACTPSLADFELTDRRIGLRKSWTPLSG